MGLASTAVAQETEMESGEAASEQEVVTLEGNGCSWDTCKTAFSS